MAAAAAARGGASLDEVAAEARGALAMKTSQLGGVTDGGALRPSTAPSRRPADAQTVLEVRNAIGLARAPGGAVRRDRPDGSTPTCGSRRSADGAPVSAKSLTNVVALGARFGDTLVVSASGPQADDVLLALAQLADEGFGDGVAWRPPPPATAPVARTQPGWPASQPETGDRGRAPASGDVLTGVPASAGLAVGPAHHLHGATAPATGPRRRRPRDRERERLDARDRRRPDRDRARPRHGGEPAPARPRPRSSTPTSRCSTTRRCSSPRSEAIDAGATAERAWHDAAQQVARALPRARGAAAAGARGRRARRRPASGRARSAASRPLTRRRGPGS